MAKSSKWTNHKDMTGFIAPKKAKGLGVPKGILMGKKGTLPVSDGIIKTKAK